MSDELKKLQQARIKQLLDLGLKFDGTSFIYESDGIYINFHHTDLLSFSEERWNKEYNGAVEAMKKQPKAIIIRSPDEFKQQAEEKGIKEWPVRPCTFCGYMLAYVFLSNRVAFDSGCECVRNRRPYEERSWGDVARYYNLQTDTDVIKKMDEFWGFNEPSA